jgi:hypothetical protein
VSEKIIGYLLLGGGIFLIVFAAVSVYWVFTDQIQPYDFVKSSSSVISIPLQLVPGAKPTQLPLNIDQILPVAKLTNTTLHIMLMGFLASVGSKLAHIGTSLVRPIVVKTREK